MSIAVITFSPQGARLAEAIHANLPDCRIYLHSALKTKLAFEARRFDRVASLTKKLFPACRGLIYIAPTGLVVRAIAPCLKHKTTDPAVVVVDAGGRWAVSLLSGHEGGANDLAAAVGNILRADPVISTTTEAVKTIIAGIGCRRGTSADDIIAALHKAIKEARVTANQIRLLASADVKAHEEGLLEASRRLGVPLRVISSDEIRQTRRSFARSEFVSSKVNLPAVAEPAALLAGRRTHLLLPKRKFKNVTVALAAENCLWSE